MGAARLGCLGDRRRAAKWDEKCVYIWLTKAESGRTSVLLALIERATALKGGYDAIINVSAAYHTPCIETYRSWMSGTDTLDLVHVTTDIRGRVQLSSAMPDDPQNLPRKPASQCP